MAHGIPLRLGFADGPSVRHVHADPVRRLVSAVRTLMVPSSSRARPARGAGADRTCAPRARADREGKWGCTARVWGAAHAVSAPAHARPPQAMCRGVYRTWATPDSAGEPHASCECVGGPGNTRNARRPGSLAVRVGCARRRMSVSSSSSANDGEQEDARPGKLAPRADAHGLKPVLCTDAQSLQRSCPGDHLWSRRMSAFAHSNRLLTVLSLRLRGSGTS